MVYLKRMLVLTLLLVFSIVNNVLRPNVDMHLSFETVGYCIINILFIIVIIIGYDLSKGIQKSTLIIVAESIITFLLVLFSFLPQIDLLTNNLISDIFHIKASQISLVYYMQFILGYWIFTFYQIVNNRNVKRSRSGSIRYMR